MVTDIDFADNFNKQIEKEHQKTRKDFDRLVIKRFREMVMQSSDPEMFINFDEDVKQLKKNRHL